MSRLDPGAATGTQTYPDQRWCACDHDKVLHKLVDGKSKACSASDCDCREFRDPPPDPWAELGSCRTIRGGED